MHNRLITLIMEKKNKYHKAKVANFEPKLVKHFNEESNENDCHQQGNVYTLYVLAD